MRTTLMSTKRQVTVPRSIVLACGVAAGLALLSACADKGFTPPKGAFSPKISLQISATAPAQQQAALLPRYLLVAALYQRQKKNNNNNGDDFQILSFVSVAVTGTTQQVTLPVDISTCLADQSRLGSKEACSLIIAAGLTYRKFDIAGADSNSNPVGESFDFQFLGPYDAAPGRIPAIPAIDLSATRFGIIGWEGDNALRLGGDDTPSFFSGWLAGVPGAGTAPPVLFAPTQGMVYPTDTRSNTFPQGPYPQLAIMQDGKWRRVSATVLPINSFPFTSVTALSATEAYVAHPTGLFKYDGSAITKVSNVTDSVFTVGSVNSSDGKYVIAGGTNGAVWIHNATTQSAPTRYSLSPPQRLDGGVCITGPSEAFAASLSGGGLWRFDGTTWTSVLGTAVTNGKGNLQCPGPGQAFVQVNGSLSLRWTGTGWTQLSNTGIGPTRGGAWAVVSASEIYMAADSASVDRAFYRFNGTNWQEVGRTRYTGGGVGRAWADPRGSAYFASALGRVEKATSSGPSVVSYQPSMRDVMMTSTTNAFVVGANAFLARWDGAKWSVDAPPPGMQAIREFKGVWTDGPKNAWAVGGNNAIVRFDGSGWSAVSDVAKPIAATDNYNAVWGSGSDVWIAGDNTIVHCKGPTACASESAPGSGVLRGIWGTSNTNVFAVGAAGRIVRYNGSSWSQMTSPATRALYRVAGSGPNDVWAVGDSTLIHFDGSQWTDAPSGGDLLGLLRYEQNTGTGGPPAMVGLSVRGPKEVYMTSIFGEIGRYDGRLWQEVHGVGFSHRIMGLSGAAVGCALAVTEAQSDIRAPTLLRGIGPTGCFGAPMTGPSSWP